MSEHTKGPWNVDPRALLRVRADNDVTICSCGTTDIIRDQWEANARRIVACVNACIGYQTEQLEELGRFISSGEAQAMAEHHKQIEQQRDELLAALEAAVEAIRLFRNESQLERLVSLRATAGYVAMDAAMDRGTAAIAKVKP